LPFPRDVVMARRKAAALQKTHPVSPLPSCFEACGNRAGEPACRVLNTHGASPRPLQRSLCPRVLVTFLRSGAAGFFFALLLGPRDSTGLGGVRHRAPALGAPVASVCSPSARSASASARAKAFSSAIHMSTQGGKGIRSQPPLGACLPRRRGNPAPESLGPSAEPRLAAASRAASSASTCSNTAASAMARFGPFQSPMKFVSRDVRAFGCVSQMSWCAAVICVCPQCSTSSCRCKFDPQAAVMYKYCVQRQPLCSCDALAHHFYQLLPLLCTSNDRCCSLAWKLNFFYIRCSLPHGDVQSFCLARCSSVCQLRKPAVGSKGG
jgi:hypothetical protein